MTTEKISWKKKIKKLQIIFFLVFLWVYVVYGFFIDAYHNYKTKSDKLENLLVKEIPAKEKELMEIKEKEKKLQNIKKNMRAFSTAYNYCYIWYVERKYWLLVKNQKSLVNCIDEKLQWKLLTKYDGFIKWFKDVELEKVAISLWVVKNNLPKFDLDQKRFLYNLDQNIFEGSLEDNITYLTLGTPILMDSKLKLYKVNFSFKVPLTYKSFIRLFQKLQSTIYVRNNLYYTISNISDFDITKKEIQNIGIQWSFYFTK